MTARLRATRTAAAVAVALLTTIGLGGCVNVQGTRDRSAPPVFEQVGDVPTATIDVDEPVTRAQAGLGPDQTVNVLGAGREREFRVLLQLDDLVLDLPATDVSFGSFDSSATADDDPVEFVDITDRLPYDEAVEQWRGDVDRFGADPDELARWEADVAALPEQGDGIVESRYTVERPGSTLSVYYRTAPERELVTVVHRVYWGDR